MAQIVAARFDTFDAATAATKKLSANGVRDDDMNVFYVSPAGRRATYPIGGDSAVDVGSAGGGATAMIGMLLFGVILGAIGWAIVSILNWHWAVIVLFVLVGGYVGSLPGALNKLGKVHKRESAGAPPPNVMLALRVEDYDRVAMIDMVRQAGGANLEETSGQWEDGEWTGFDAAALS